MSSCATNTVRITGSWAWRDDLPPSWDATWRSFSSDQRRYLSEVVTYCVALGVDPKDVTQKHLEDFAKKRLKNRQGAAYLVARAKINTSVTKWNEADRKLELPPLKKLETAKSARLAAKNAAPGEFAGEIAAFKAWAEGEVAANTVTTKVNRLHDAVAIARSVDCKFESFRDFNEESLEIFADAKIFGSIETLSVRRNRIFGELKALYGKVLNDEPMATTIEALRDVFPKATLDLPDKALDRLAPYDRAEAMSDLLQACDQTLAQFERRPMKQSAASAQAAIGIVLVNNLALKRGHLLSAGFTGPLREDGAVKRPALMATVYGKFENLDLLVGEEIIDMIDRYWSAVTKLALGFGPLFVTSQKKEKIPACLTVSFLRLGQEVKLYTGPQLLRDLAVKRMIEAVESGGEPLGDEDLKDVIGYSETANFTLRYEVFRQRMVAQVLSDAAQGLDDGD